MAKIGRNQPCPCGSGKKYKHCCWLKDKKGKGVNNQNTNLTDMNDKISDNPSNKKLKQGINSLESIKSLIELGLFDGFQEFDKEGILKEFNKLDKLKEDLNILECPDKFNQIFNKRGWIAYGSMNADLMKTAVIIANDEDINSAENYLVEEYSKNLKEMISIYFNYPEEFKIRKHLLDLAYNDYIEERYYSSVFLLLSIIDGIVADSNEADGKGFHAAENDIYAWDSIAAHKTGLNELQKLFYQNRGQTNPEEIFIPFRNGIMHGRDLNFNNKLIATKLWATLFALKDGIMVIKNKGKNPPKEEGPVSLIDSLKTFSQNQEKCNLLEKECDEWENRHYKVDEDFKSSENLEDYEEGTPEYALVQFFDYWKKRNFGYIAQMQYKSSFEEFNMNDEAGILAREVFNNKKLLSFKILSIDDQSSQISNFNVELKIKYNDEVIFKELDFRLVYQPKEKEDIAVRLLHNGEWKITSYFNIKNLS